MEVQRVCTVSAKAVHWKCKGCTGKRSSFTNSKGGYFDVIKNYIRTKAELVKEKSFIYYYYYPLVDKAVDERSNALVNIGKADFLFFLESP